MKTLLTNGYIKTAGSWDDQPGFKNRDMHPGALPESPAGHGETDEFDRKKKKKRKKKRLMKNIYQLGIDVPVMDRDIKKQLINL